jgi:hypothetical protein
VTVAGEVGLGHRFAQLGEPVLLSNQLGLERQYFMVTRRCRIPDGARAAEIAQLVQHRDAQTIRPGDAPARRLELTGDQPEKRGFSRAVPAHDAPAFPGGDREGHVAEQGPDAEANTDAAEGQESHGNKLGGTAGRRDGGTELPASCCSPLLCAYRADRRSVTDLRSRLVAGSW